jgi:hypothetical protein
MSIDFDAVCLTCQQSHHLGQQMGGKWSFGFGSNDDPGRASAGEFILKHSDHDLRIYETDFGPDGVQDSSCNPPAEE